MELLVFILICYGASNIMVFSSLFEKWRLFWNKISPNFFGDLFECMICLPFWWGVILSLAVYSPSAIYVGAEYIILAAFLDGCLASGSVWFLHTIQEYMEPDE